MIEALYTLLKTLVKDAAFALPVVLMMPSSIMTIKIDISNVIYALTASEVPCVLSFAR
jgi:hypothetical protein